MGQKYSAEQWEQVLGEYRKRNTTVKEWCESKGVSENSLYYWQKS